MEKYETDPIPRFDMHALETLLLNSQINTFDAEQIHERRVERYHRANTTRDSSISRSISMP